MVVSNHKGVVWLFLIRLHEDNGIGFSVEEGVDGHRNKKNIVVNNVDPSGPAARAGIRLGDAVRGYTLDPLSKPLTKQLWDETTTPVLNAQEQLVGIQVRRSGELTSIQQTQARMVEKFRLKKRHELACKDPLGTWTVDEDVASWDRRHSAGLQGNSDQSPPPIQGPGQGNPPIQGPGQAAPLIEDQASDQASPIDDSMEYTDDHPMEYTNDHLMEYDAHYPIEYTAREPLIDRDELTLVVDQMTETSAVSGTKLTFRQVGGPLVEAELYGEWRDKLEETAWLDENTIRALSSYVVQVIPYERLCILDTTIMAQGTWKDNHPVACLPLCVETHWVLVVVVQTSSTTTIFHMNSHENDIGEKAATAIASCFAIATIVKIKVPIQVDSSSSGVHVISHLESVIKVVNTIQDDEEIVQMLTTTKFKDLRSRADLVKDLDDAFQHTGCCLKNWAQYVCDGNAFWWPCLVISRRLARRFSKRPKRRGYVPVVWFKKKLFNVVWINDTREPLSKWTDEDVIRKCPFSANEEFLLREAYAQAKAF